MVSMLLKAIMAAINATVIRESSVCFVANSIMHISGLNGREAATVALQPNMAGDFHFCPLLNATILLTVYY